MLEKLSTLYTGGKKSDFLKIDTYRNEYLKEVIELTIGREKQPLYHICHCHRSGTECK